MEAEKLGIPLLQPEKLSTVEGTVRGIEPRVMVSASYGAWLPQWFLTVAPLGVINIHPSLLPMYRGASPVIKTVLNGDRVTGVSFMLTDSGWDTGDLLRVCEYHPGDLVTAGELEKSLALLAAQNIGGVLLDWQAGKLQRVSQIGEGCYAEKVTPDESVINWTLSAGPIQRMILAYNPVPGARTVFRGGILKVHRARSTSGSGAPGTVISTDPPIIACGEGSLLLEEVQPQGKKRMSGADFFRGYRLSRGDSLGGI